MSTGQLYPWQIDATRQWLARSQLPHATLLLGMAGTGKRVLARVVAQALLCETPAADRPDRFACGRCPSCHWFAQGTHPDYREVTNDQPEEETADGAEGGGSAGSEWIKIDAVRRVTDAMAQTANRGGARVVVIDPAEAMMAAAANALLKTLEEPPTGVYFLLISAQPKRLLPTIRSRCQVWHAPRPSEAEAVSWLEAQGCVDAPVVLAEAGGAPLRALELAAPEWRGERKEFLSQLFDPRQLAVLKLGEALDRTPKAERRQKLVRWLHWLATATHDIALAQVAGTVRFHPDFAEPALALARKVAPLAVLRYHRKVLAEQRLAAHPLNPRLWMEALLLDYKDAMRFDGK